MFTCPHSIFVECFVVRVDMCFVVVVLFLDVKYIPHVQLSTKYFCVESSSETTEDEESAAGDDGSKSASEFEGEEMFM